MKTAVIPAAMALTLWCGQLLASADTLSPYGAIPGPHQIQWHEKEMYVLVHFTPTTFENKEWGYGDADPSVFNPSDFDARQITEAVRSGGFKGLILVAKHHDGFCLWPTKTTDYNISRSPWKAGKGDMVKEFEQACRVSGLEFGVYCSPWDRNHPEYGNARYVEVYRTQLRELYTQYGPLFMSWHDGANGGDGYYGGKREHRTIDRTVYYGWDSTWKMTRELQPGACIFSDVGPDVRWVGNEHGAAAPTSWATFTPMPVKGQQTIGPGDMDYTQSPTGTRNGKAWIPAECDVPLRPGWFYHPEQDTKVKSTGELFDIYLKSVGRGGALDLGISPDRRGRLHEQDVRVLASFGRKLRETFATDLAAKARVQVSSSAEHGGGLSTLTDGDRYTYWSNLPKDQEPWITLEWGEPVRFNLIQLRENIKLGQRVERGIVEIGTATGWAELARFTSVGAGRLIHLEKPVQTKRLRIRFLDSPVPLAISTVGLFQEAVSQ